MEEKKEIYGKDVRKGRKDRTQQETEEKKKDA